MMSINFAEAIAHAMTEIRRGSWQVPGCKRMLLDYAHEAPVVPLGEIGAAALIFASTPSVQVPSLELFRAGQHWRNSPEHERTLRPADQPRCDVDGHEHALLPCRLCASEAKAHPDDEPKGIKYAPPEGFDTGLALARLAMRQAVIPETQRVTPIEQDRPDGPIRVGDERGATK